MAIEQPRVLHSRQATVPNHKTDADFKQQQQQQLDLGFGLEVNK